MLKYLRQGGRLSSHSGERLTGADYKGYERLIVSKALSQGKHSKTPQAIKWQNRDVILIKITIVFFHLGQNLTQL